MATAPSARGGPRRTSKSVPVRNAARRQPAKNGGSPMMKFAGEVGDNYAKGFNKVTSELHKAVSQHMGAVAGTNQSGISTAVRNGPKAQAALRKATGR